MARRSLDLIAAMRVIAKAAQPITGRGVGYKLFTQGLCHRWPAARCSASIGCF